MLKRNGMKISVIMTTYNGSKFIVHQLDSLRNQTRTIDEVLIFDDGSTDGTQQIVLDYIDSYNLINWHFYINKSNKGWKRNFYDGVIQASGDLVFPCDQDDIWKLDKIEKMEKIMIENNKINVLVGKYEKFFDDRCNNISDSKKRTKSKFYLWENVSLTIDRIEDKKNKKKIDGSVNCFSADKSLLQLMPGCCFCIRKSFFDFIKPYWTPDLGHDAFYTFYGKLCDCFAIYNYIVIKWRHYNGSTSRPKGRKRETRYNELLRNKKLIENLIMFCKENDISDRNEKIVLLENFRKWSDLRMSFFDRRKISYGLKLMKYKGFYERSRALITDWIYVFMK